MAPSRPVSAPPTKSSPPSADRAVETAYLSRCPWPAGSALTASVSGKNQSDVLAWHQAFPDVNHRGTVSGRDRSCPLLSTGPYPGHAQVVPLWHVAALRERRSDRPNDAGDLGHRLWGRFLTAKVTARGRAVREGRPRVVHQEDAACAPKNGSAALSGTTHLHGPARTSDSATTRRRCGWVGCYGSPPPKTVGERAAPVGAPRRSRPLLSGESGGRPGPTALPGAAG
jgi:hypothetical protein